MQKIILDTDFLLCSLRFRIDLFSELRRIIDDNFEVYILDKTLEELKGKKDARLALEYSKKLKIINAAKQGSFDDLITDFKDYIIATQDKVLKEKLKKAGFGIITIRQKRYLIKENVL
ncbi:MAG: PIN domain-containing protein [Nanoarchaeota archaeon]